MNDLNSILLEGTLVDDPKRIALADQPDGVRLVKFDLASNRYYKDRNGQKAQETVFISVQCWGTLGDRCIELMKKGMHCRIVGRIRLCRWVSGDGSAKRTIEIVASHLEFRRPRTGTAASGMEILEDTDNECDSAGEAAMYYSF